MFMTMKYFILLFIFFGPLVQAVEMKKNCDKHYLQEQKIAVRANQSVWEASRAGLANPFKYIVWDWQFHIFKYASSYIEYIDKYEKLLDYSDAEFESKMGYAGIEPEVIACWLSDKHNVRNILSQGIHEVQSLFFDLYDECIRNHKNLESCYQRGRIHFDLGNTNAFLEDMKMLFSNETPYISNNEELYFIHGKSLSEANLYDQAIVALSKAISINPKNKEAYLERAVAYFETGNFNLALTDYISSNIRPNNIDLSNKNYAQYIKLAQGISFGCLKGGYDSAVDFVPSLFATAHGIGRGLWAFASEPVQISKDLVDSCLACVEYIKENVSPELLLQLIPELKECIELWDGLDTTKKGYYIGYVIGRYGVDVFA